jgi:hypothetical protein
MGIYSKSNYPVKKCSPKCQASAYPCRPKRACWPWPEKQQCKPVKPKCHYPEYICKPAFPKKRVYENQAVWMPSGGDHMEGWDSQDTGAFWGEDQQDVWAPQDGEQAWGQDQQEAWDQQGFRYPHWYAEDDGQQAAWYQQTGYGQQDGWGQQYDAGRSDWGFPWETGAQSAWPADGQAAADGQDSRAAQDNSTLGAIRSAILDQLGQLGIRVDETDFLADLGRLSQKELFALLGLLGLLSFFVLLGFLSSEDLAVE